MEQDFLRGSDRSQNVRVGIAAAAMASIIAIVAVVFVLVQNRVDKSGRVFIGLDTAYVAPGIVDGSAVMLRGVKIGEVTALERVSDTTVHLDLALDENTASALTDTFQIDYRPANYFGVTAVNVLGGSGGNPLTDGLVLAQTPLGDYSMSRMLEKASLVVDGTLTDDFVSTLDKVVRYTNGLTPMIETFVTVGDRIAKAQTDIPSMTIGHVNDILEVLPVFDDEVIAGLYGLYTTRYNWQADGSYGLNEDLLDHAEGGLALASGSLFGAAGALLKSHGTELTPVVNDVQMLTDTVPHVLANGSLTAKLQTLVGQYNAAFTAPDGTPRLDLRIVLDRLPVLEAPVGLPLIHHQEGPR